MRKDCQPNLSVLLILFLILPTTIYITHLQLLRPAYLAFPRWTPNPPTSCISCFPKMDSQLLLPAFLLSQDWFPTPAYFLAFPRLISYLPTLPFHIQFNGLAFTRSISNFPTLLYNYQRQLSPWIPTFPYVPSLHLPRRLSPWIPTCLIALTNLI